MKIRTIISILAAATFIAVVSGGFLYYRVSRNSLLREAHGNAELQTRMIADHIRAYLSEFQKGASVLAEITDMRMALKMKAISIGLR